MITQALLKEASHPHARPRSIPATLTAPRFSMKVQSGCLVFRDHLTDGEPVYSLPLDQVHLLTGSPAAPPKAKK